MKFRFRDAVLAAVACVLIVAGHLAPAGPGALAQERVQDLQQRITALSNNLEDAAKSVRNDGLDDGGLLQLRARVEPLSDSLQSVIGDLQPLLDGAKQRLEQLGPKPDEKTAPESPEAAKERTELQKEVEEYDSQMKRARVVSVRITQVLADITNARRELLLGQIFKATGSAASPRLWSDAAQGMPRFWRSNVAFFSDWADRFRSRLTGARLLRFIGALVILVGAYYALRRLSRRFGFRRRHGETPSSLERVSVALWSGFVLSALPLAAAYGFVSILRFFDLITLNAEPVVAAFLEAVRVIAGGLGLARAIFSPGYPEWQLLGLPDAVARKYNALAVNFVCVIAALRIVEAIDGVVTAPLDVSVAFRALFTLGSAIVLARALIVIGRMSRSFDAELGPRLDQKRDWFALWRLAIWLAIIAVIGANIFGYINFANFVTTQIMWVTFILTVGFLLHMLSHELIARYLRPESAFALGASTTLGINTNAFKQISILLSGLFTLLIYFVSILLILAPWGVESDNVFDTLKAAFFGFSFGAINFSLSAVAIAIILFVLGLVATRAFQRWLGGNYLPSTELDAGLQNSITTSAGYVGVLAAMALPFAYLGFNFDKLAIVAGALSVGIGFGLQSVVSNFVSGLILLWERAVKVGDWVVVGGDQGIVKRINVRSTEIETFERQTVIVPNSNLISGVVKNWVRIDRKGRINLEIKVEYNSDPADVRDIMIECAKAHQHVLESPAPSVLFTEFANTSLNFDLRCFIDDVDNMGRTRSDLRFEIFRRFREKGIIIAQPVAGTPAAEGS